MKVLLGINVYESAIQRIKFIIDKFDSDFYVAFSGGKDSSLLLNLTLQIARREKKVPVKVFFIDLEAQYTSTINHVKEMFDSPDIEGYWVALPISLRNSVSSYEPKWIPWDKEVKKKWIRPFPKYKYVISEENCPFKFYKGMEFEELMLVFADYLALNKSKSGKMGCLVGIRSDESYNRVRTLFSKSKIKYDDKSWSTKLKQCNQVIYNFYPIYDWKVCDIWKAVFQNNFPYNHIYNHFFFSGVKLNNMRICQPYGDDQRKGLDLFHLSEPLLWEKILKRVEGVNFGTIYKNEQTLGYRKIALPEHHTYKSYSYYILNTMPLFLKEHYISKINIFLKWWHKKLMGDANCIILDFYDELGIFQTILVDDFADLKLERERKVPSWRRILKTLLKNDFYCTHIGFAPTKNSYLKLKKLREKYEKNKESLL